jgi:NTP pyrophosphatase (non-canonical NTP hydrolase)
MTDPLGKEPRTYEADYAACITFMGDMHRKMQKNRDKAHWSTVSKFWLLNRLKQEVHELHDALLNDPDNVISECADVANFAMMIADKCR